jgi:thymidylate kinase
VFPRPDLVFHLDLSVEDALLRKRAQSAYERGFGDGDRAFLEFQHRVRGRWMVLAATQGPWLHLDASRPERELVDVVVAAVRERLGA